MYVPLTLKCHCDLDICPRNPKFNRGHLLVVTKDYTKKSSIVIDWTRLVYGPTDGRAYRPTDRPTCAKQYTSHFFEGEHNKMHIFIFRIFTVNIYCSLQQNIFPYFHWSSAELLSSNIQIIKYNTMYIATILITL